MNIFISRDLSSSSPIRSLEAEGHTLIDQSGIAIKPIPFQSFSDTEWLFFYSQNAIRYFHKWLSSDKVVGLKHKSIGVMGQASASLVKSLFNCEATFIAAADPDASASAFQTATQHQSVLFIGATNSRLRFQDTTNPLHKSLIVYQNSPIPHLTLPLADIYVFTSPLNVQAFCEKSQPSHGQIVMAIGHSTGKALEMFVPAQDILICDQPDEATILDHLRQIIQAKRG